MGVATYVSGGMDGWFVLETEEGKERDGGGGVGGGQHQLLWRVSLDLFDSSCAAADYSLGVQVYGTV